MCVIIDASVAGLVFSSPHHPNFKPLWNWLENKDGRIVYGGYLVKELELVARRMLARLKQSGLALECPAKKVEQEETAVRKLKKCRSNDLHVVALARASGARVLCTNDHKLEADFKDLEIVPHPKGQIYKNPKHARMLKHNNICIGRKK